MRGRRLHLMWLAVRGQSGGLSRTATVSSPRPMEATYSVNKAWIGLSLSMRQTLCSTKLKEVVLLRPSKSWLSSKHSEMRFTGVTLESVLLLKLRLIKRFKIITEWLGFCLCTHQVDFFLQLIHVLLPLLALLLLLLLAIGGGRQLVLLFPSLHWGKLDKIRPSTSGEIAPTFPLLLHKQEGKAVSTLLFKHAVKLALIIVRTVPWITLIK